MVSANIGMTLLFRVLGCVSPDFDYALKFVTTSDYPIQYQDGHRWLRWIFWINPIGLSVTSFMANEFNRIKMTCTDDSLIPFRAGYNDIRHQACTLAGSVPGTRLIKDTDFLAKGYSIFAGDVWRNWGITIVLIAFLLFLNIFLGEYVQFSSKNGSVKPYHVPIEERNDYVEEIIGLLEMEDLADCIIGSPDASLTVEQRKRVTIGVELAAKPELLLFLDEPTSGLDSQSAFNIVRLLRKLSIAGQAIICTIHQPNAALFENFDRLLLLPCGGNAVYFGDTGQEACVLREYLAINGEVAPPTAKIAEFMLEAVGAGSAPRIGDRDWADVWKESPEFACVKRTITQIREERGKFNPASASADAKEYASPFHHQLRIVTSRMTKTFWRSPNYPLMRIINHITFGVIVGLAYINLDNSRSALQRKVFVVFQSVVLPVLLITQVEVTFDLKRLIFFGNHLPRSILAEVPYSVICSVCFFLPVYFISGLQHTLSRAGYQFFMVLLIEFFAITLAQGVPALSPSAAVSSQYDPFLTTIFILFCRVTIPHSQMLKGWRVWLYNIIPLPKSLVAWRQLNFMVLLCPAVPQNLHPLRPLMNGGRGYIVEDAMSNCPYCVDKMGDEFYNPLSMSFDTRWRDLGIIVAFIASNMIVTFLAASVLRSH
ncbi:ABC-2 type transporter-domain-containing protein [Fusarium sp. MPI-SDFR-AT-0072]|nr:ABC-2 type transporter-domain-containing protein [Fusarium sp. MPI-SDFR-AT-0072]